MAVPVGFEWDEGKAAANVAKHGVSFDEAATVFEDPDALEDDDGAGAGVLVIIGYSIALRLLLVVFVERDDRDRIISARQATPEERRRYEG